MNVVFLLYNRPELTRQVFARIREARPDRLLIVCDGPNPDRSGDEVKVQAVRDIVADANIDWPCDVRRNYADTNMGCRLRVSSGLDWVFELVEEAIILEDDCLPDLSFFPYCNELLDRFAHDTRIMMISGDRFVPSPLTVTDSYTLTRFCHIWGWATWRRAWKQYDVKMSSWPQMQKTRFWDTLSADACFRRYFSNLFDQVYQGNIDTWDLQWQYATFVHSAYSIAPAVNLVKNIGIGQDATHTAEDSQRTDSKETHAIDLPLQHPDPVRYDAETDFRTLHFCLIKGSVLRRAIRYLTWNAVALLASLFDFRTPQS